VDLCDLRHSYMEFVLQEVSTNCLFVGALMQISVSTSFNLFCLITQKW
jgi:hypothetical protein